MEQQQYNNETTTIKRASINYENGKIYKIVGGNEHYIGSTTQRYVSQRFSQHVAKYNRYKKTGKEFVSSFILFDKYGVDGCSIELIEYFSCKHKQELEKREFSHIQSSPCVNKQKQQRNNKKTTTNQLQIKCDFCSAFTCKLKSDYDRHIESEFHIKNKAIADANKSLQVQDEALNTINSLHTRVHDMLLHQRKMKAVLKQYWKQADYAIHVFKLKQSFAEIHDYLVATEYVGYPFK